MLAELAILGAITTALVQIIKQGVKGKAATLGVLAAISFVLATVVWLLQEYNLWSTFLGIMATANLIYSFIIQHMEQGFGEWIKELDIPGPK